MVAVLDEQVVGCNTLLSANFFRCLKLEFCGAGCEESHPRVRFWCCWCFRIRNTTMVCTPCASAGGRDALLPVGTCEGKPGAPEELFQSLTSAQILSFSREVEVRRMRWSSHFGE